MTQAELQKLKPIIQKELSFNEDNLQSKFQELIIKRCTYIDLMTKETTKLKNLRTDKEVLYAELYDKIKFHSDIRREKRDEIESQMYREPKFLTVCKEIILQEEIVSYLEEVIQSFKDLSFQLRGTLDLMKYKAGLDI